AQARFSHAASLLTSGDVLVTGGFQVGLGSYSRTAELFSLVPGRWTGAGTLVQPRALHTSTTLDNGDVLIVGGSTTQYVPLSTAERYTPSTGRWTAAAAMAEARVSHTATFLPRDGQILVTGGLAGTAIRQS